MSFSLLPSVRRLKKWKKRVEKGGRKKSPQSSRSLPIIIDFRKAREGHNVRQHSMWIWRENQRTLYSLEGRDELGGGY